MDLLPLLAPVFLLFEIWQLVISERYLGIKQIARGTDPRLLGLGEMTAFFWSMALVAYWAWALLLLFTHEGRLYGLALAAICAIGYVIRRGAAHRRVLVILTVEGALRVGLLFALCATVWWYRR